MISGKVRLGALICLIATLTACGGGEQNTNTASLAPAATAQPASYNWGAYSDTEIENPPASSDTYQVLRSWWNATGAITAHLAIEQSSQKLVLLSPDLQSTVVRFTDGPTVDPQTSAAWVAPNHNDAGIIQIGMNLHRFEWNGSKATLSPVIYTLQTQGELTGVSYFLTSDDNGFVLLDHTTLVMIAPNGELTRTVDLLNVNGISSTFYVERLSMNPREVLLPVSHGLLSVNRETGQTHWIDQFDGSHGVKRVLWTSNDSTGYLVQIPDPGHWHERVMRVSSTGVKQVVADQVLAPFGHESIVESSGHKEIRQLGISLSGPHGPDTSPRAGAFSPLTPYTVWCDLPVTATEGQWTCKGNNVFAYDVASQVVTLLGTLNTQVEHSTPSSMRTASDVVVDSQYLFAMGTPADTDGTNPPQMQEEVWQFSPATPGSLHWVETNNLP